MGLNGMLTLDSESYRLQQFVWRHERLWIFPRTDEHGARPWPVARCGFLRWSLSKCLICNWDRSHVTDVSTGNRAGSSGRSAIRRQCMTAFSFFCWVIQAASHFGCRSANSPRVDCVNRLSSLKVLHVKQGLFGSCSTHTARCPLYRVHTC